MEMEVFQLYYLQWPTATIIVGQPVVVYWGKTNSLLASSLVSSFCHVVEGANPNADVIQTQRFIEVQNKTHDGAKQGRGTTLH